MACGRIEADATSPTDPDTATGGTASDLPESWSPCYREYEELEPPCDEWDIGGLISSCGLWFEVPLAHVATPASGLQVVPAMHQGTSSQVT